MTDQLVERLEIVRERIDAARARGAGQKVQLIAVSKNHAVEKLQTLYDAGVRAFGESYVQEWQAKRKELPDDVEWHFIGALQSNKAKYLVGRAALIHSLDRKSLMKAVQKRAEAPVAMLVQVNLGKEAAKSGIGLEELEEFLLRTEAYPKVSVRGLMGVVPYAENPEENRPYFRSLAQKAGELREKFAGSHPALAESLKELSMGMSDDFEIAIEEGATMVRLGTILFGERKYDE